MVPILVLLFGGYFPISGTFHQAKFNHQIGGVHSHGGTPSSLDGKKIMDFFPIYKWMIWESP